MPIQLESLVDPAHTALVTSECQQGVIGDASALPELAAAARDVLPNVVRLVEVGRRAGVSVVHCLAERRADGRGANTNARLFAHMARAEQPLLPGSPATELVDEIPRAESDLVLRRLHGVSPFQGTELDSLLRNLGVRSVVCVGVSVNVAIPNLVFDCVNASYQAVVPRDAVAGFPADYVEAVFRNTLGAVATLPSTDQLVEAWS